MRNDQIGRQNLVELCKFLVNGLTERRDLLLIAHVDRKSDRTAALPFSSWVLPRVVIQVLSGTLVSAADFDEVTQIDRSAGRRCGHCDVAYRVYVFELTRGVENYLALAGLVCSARSDDVASTEQICQCPWLQSVCG